VEQVTKQGKRYEKVLLAAAALIGLGGFAHSSRLVEEGGIAAPNFITSNLANGLDSGYSWYYEAASLLTWTPLGGTLGTQLVCLEFFRDFDRVDFVSAAEGSKLYIDNQWAEGIQVYEFTLADVLTSDWGKTRDEFIQYIPVYDQDGVLTYTWADFLTDNQNELNTTLAVDFMHFGWVPSGPVATVAYQYRVKPYLVRLQPDDTYAFVWDTETSDASYLISVATPEAMPFWSDGATWYDNPELANIAGHMVATFHFYAAVGADEMILQVARDPNVSFDASSLYTEVIPGTDPSAWYPQQITRQVVLDDVPGTSNIFWWRVGGRNRQSDVAPRPYPLILANDYGYVWSGDVYFTTAGMSAAGDARPQRADILRARSTHQRAPTRDRGDRILSVK